eukprot:5647009-Amphidinium_carterae.1
MRIDIRASHSQPTLDCRCGLAFPCLACVRLTFRLGVPIATMMALLARPCKWLFDKTTWKKSIAVLANDRIRG